MARSFTELGSRIDALGANEIVRWVNNAGIVVEPTNPKPVWETDPKAWDTTMAVNTTGVFYGIRSASAQMITQEPNENGDRGWIVNLASVFGLVAAASTCKSACVRSRKAPDVDGYFKFRMRAANTP